MNAIRQHACTAKAALIAKIARLGRRQAWDDPTANVRDPATVALSEKYERAAFIAAYCKRRDLAEARWKASLDGLLDEYAAGQKSRRRADIAEWLDTQRIRAAVNLKWRQPINLPCRYKP